MVKYARWCGHPIRNTLRTQKDRTTPRVLKMAKQWVCSKTRTFQTKLQKTCSISAMRNDLLLSQHPSTQFKEFCKQGCRNFLELICPFTLHWSAAENGTLDIETTSVVTCMGLTFILVLQVGPAQSEQALIDIVVNLRTSGHHQLYLSCLNLRI